MSALTPEKLAELRRLLDANEVPWSAHRPSPNYARYEIRDDRGYDLAYTVEDALGGNAEIIVAAVNALPALLDAAAERDALAAGVERVRDWLDHRGVDVSDRDSAYMDGYRAAQRHAVTDAAELRAAIDGAESWHRATVVSSKAAVLLHTERPHR